MLNLLAGLEKMGIKNIDGKLYEEKKVGDATKQKSGQKSMREADYLFDKAYECPVCYRKFTAKTVKTGKVRLLRTDINLRPVFENIEPLKYEIVVCPSCGYAVSSHYFQGLANFQIKAIRENISSSFYPIGVEKTVYTYEDALERYKLCLANAIVKHAKASEKAYICLKAGWLLQSMRENLDRSRPDHEKKAAEITEKSREFLKNALDGFITARQSEHYPICGMDEATSEYLIAALAMEFGDYGLSARMISNILLSRSVSSRIKDKARDLKEMMLAKKKEEVG